MLPFIDLKSQYKALKTEIDEGIFKVLEHGQFILGPEVKECEKALAEFVGAKHAITCSNGSDALQMAMMALDIGQGDEVITTAFSFIATAEMIALLGAIPVFVDIDPKTYNINPAKIREAITPKTKAIAPVGLYGQPADYDEIKKIADEFKLPIIEDAAQSFGAQYKDKKSGALGLIGCTSFFPAKPLGCYGDGGALFTNDDELAETLMSIRMHGMGKHRYSHSRLGINGRMDSLQCAVILAKLKRYPWEIESRQKVAERYTEAFKGLANHEVTPPSVQPGCQSVWAQYTLRVKDRDGFQSRMKELGVPTAVHYPRTMADQEAYKSLSRCHDITEARKASESVVSLPMYPDMTDEVQNQIIKAVQTAIKGVSV